MSDKQTHKTFEDAFEIWDEQNGLTNGFDIYATTASYFWSAATEATRAKYDDKIKAMQAEIDKRDARIKHLEYKDFLIRKNKNFAKRWRKDFGARSKELNQRGEDE